jgi:23S rRNA pseudouridine2605 synthase
VSGGARGHRKGGQGQGGQSGKGDGKGGQGPAGGRGRTPKVPGERGRGRPQTRTGAVQGRPAGQPPRRRPQPEVSADVHVPDGIRLQKVLAQAGVASRRACEELIAAGRVEVDGQVVTELGVRIDPKRSSVHVDGMRIQLDETLVYIALNKPLGVVSSMTPSADPQNRPSIADLVADREERLFHVGRLDVDTEGLILLTNDGELANRLTHPSYEVPKTYLVEVAGPLARDVGRRLLAGVELDDGLGTVDSFKVVDARPGKALIEVVLHDGRNRIVRRLMDAVGHPVEQLVRVRMGPLRLGDLRTGRTRVLNKAEVASLMQSVGL